MRRLNRPPPGGYRERLHPTRRYPFQIRQFITKSKHDAEQIRQTDDGPHHVARPARRAAGNPSRPAGERNGAERNGTERGIRSRRPPRKRPKRVMLLPSLKKRGSAYWRVPRRLVFNIHDRARHVKTASLSQEAFGGAGDMVPPLIRCSAEPKGAFSCCLP